MINITYKDFFTVELLHKYFANGLCADFDVYISAATKQLLQNNRIVLKQYGSKLYAGVQVDNNTGLPLIVPSKDARFTFFMKVNNNFFYNYTNLPSNVVPGKIYYFTNRNNNIQNTKKNLSLSTPYNAATTYNPGDIATDGSGIVFQCISKCIGITPSIAHADHWMKIDNNQYVSEADTLQWLPSISTYTLSVAQTAVQVDVYGYNIPTHDYTNHLIAKNISFSTATTQFSLDLSSLPSGKYFLSINGGSKQGIYINDELKSIQAFGVIDIFNDAGVSANYQLLDNANNIQLPLYTINFLNRATIWKYILNTTSKGAITATGYGFPAAAGNVIFSKTPIPLSEVPLTVKLSLSTVNNHAVNPVIQVTSVACASPQMLIPYSVGADNYACSEIFLNY